MSDEESRYPSKVAYPVLRPFILRRAHDRSRIGDGIAWPDGTIVVRPATGPFFTPAIGALLHFDSLEPLRLHYMDVGLTVEVEWCVGFAMIPETDWAKQPAASKWARTALAAMAAEAPTRPYQLCTDWQLAQGALRSLEGSGPDGDTMREVFIRWAITRAEQDKAS